MHGKKVVACGDSVVRIGVKNAHGEPLIDVITKGRRQGVATKKQDPLSDVKARSLISKGHLFSLHSKLVELVQGNKQCEDKTYHMVKLDARDYNFKLQQFHMTFPSWEGNGTRVDDFPVEYDPNRVRFHSQHTS